MRSRLMIPIATISETRQRPHRWLFDPTRNTFPVATRNIKAWRAYEFHTYGICFKHFFFVFSKSHFLGLAPVIASQTAYHISGIEVAKRSIARPHKWPPIFMWGAHFKRRIAYSRSRRVTAKTTRPAHEYVPYKAFRADDKLCVAATVYLSMEQRMRKPGASPLRVTGDNKNSVWYQFWYI